MVAIVLLALVAMMVMLVARAAQERRVQVRVPVRITQRRATRRR